MITSASQQPFVIQFSATGRTIVLKFSGQLTKQCDCLLHIRAQHTSRILQPVVATQSGQDRLWIFKIIKPSWWITGGEE